MQYQRGKCISLKIAKKRKSLQRKLVGGQLVIQSFNAQFQFYPLWEKIPLEHADMKGE